MIEIEGINPQMIANNMEPFEPTHPGEVLKDEIDYRGISVKQLAEDIGVSYGELDKVTKGKLAMSPKMALLCEQSLGIPAYIFLRLQSDYDLQIVKRDKSFLQKLANVRKVAALL